MRETRRRDNISMSVIDISNLTRDYGGGKGIFDVTFQVDEGEVFGFLGPNGAGKTTAIRHPTGFIKNKSAANQTSAIAGAILLFAGAIVMYIAGCAVFCRKDLSI